MDEENLQGKKLIIKGRELVWVKNSAGFLAGDCPAQQPECGPAAAGKELPRG
jgi:hypothetical protein